MGYRLRRPVRASELCQVLGLALHGSDRTIEAVAGYLGHEYHDLTFTASPMSHVHGVAIMGLPEKDQEYIASDSCILVSGSPRTDFIRALEHLQTQVGFDHFTDAPFVHPTVVIGQNVIIEPGCRVGAHSILEHNVVLHAGTRIGERSRIRANTAIGGDGFGFARPDDGPPVRFPHLGGVVIGDDVEVGSCSTISRGTLSDTELGTGVKISNLVHIAHNCIIGDGAILTVGVVLSGGTTVGSRAWLGPNTSTRQKVSIGDGAFVGVGAVVIHDVPRGAVQAGNPATTLNDRKSKS